MATKKSNNYIEMELEWLERKAQELRDYCDVTPVAKIKDRIIGGRLTANIEQQIKSIRETLQDYIKIIDAIDRLRDKEASKSPQVRGDQELSPMEKGEI
jgi:ribosomal protein S2